MFIRAELKQNAKRSIQQNIWTCIGVTLAFSILVGGSFGVNVDPSTLEPYFRAGLGSAGNISLDFINIPLTVGLAGMAMFAVFLYNIFISGPLQVGYAQFYLENRKAPSSFEVLFSMFRSGIYLNVVKIMLLRNIFTILWFMLFIIPGIYKAYQYAMIPYILAENPGMESRDVFNLTKTMTQGVKFDMFVLDFSFFPWYLLIFMTCGLAGLYVTPYVAATNCELYCYLRDVALEAENKTVEEEYVEPTIDDLH